MALSAISLLIILKQLQQQQAHQWSENKETQQQQEQWSAQGNSTGSSNSDLDSDQISWGGSEEANLRVQAWFTSNLMCLNWDASGTIIPPIPFIT